MKRLLFRALIALFLAALAVGCASPSLRQADTYFEAQSYRQAIRAYETRLNARPQAKDVDRILFRLALAHTLAVPERAENKTADELLKRLIREHPDSPYRAQAGLILDLQAHLASLRQDIDARTELLQDLLVGADHLQENLRRLAGEKDDEIDRLDAQLNALKAELRRRSMEITTREEKIARLERELRELKRIDTGGSAP